MIDLVSIRIDGGTQGRAHLSEDAIEDYAAALHAGAALPPIVVFHDGETYWLADGFHRYHANLKNGATRIAADVRQGTRRDAVLHSVGANSEHGLRRTNEDKRRSVLTLLEDREWSQWSDGEIAKAARVDRKTVNRMRGSLTCTSGTSEAESRRSFIAKNGEKSTMSVEKIGRTRVVLDPEFQAEAEAAARDLEVERDERIALSGTGHLFDENEKMRKKIGLLDKRIASLLEENASLKFREKMWKERAIAAGWKGRADAA